MVRIVEPRYQVRVRVPAATTSKMLVIPDSGMYNLTALLTLSVPVGAIGNIQLSPSTAKQLMDDYVNKTTYSLWEDWTPGVQDNSAGSATTETSANSGLYTALRIVNSATAGAPDVIMDLNLAISLGTTFTDGVPVFIEDIVDNTNFNVPSESIQTISGFSPPVK